MCEQTETNRIKEEICRKLRACVEEFGQAYVTGAVILYSGDIGYFTGGHKCIQCPTIAIPKLGNVEYKVARFFEEGA
jgi:hypothetical protein